MTHFVSGLLNSHQAKALHQAIEKGFKDPNYLSSVSGEGPVVEFEQGGRIMCDMTDRHPEKVKVGMEVDMTFRKLYYVGGIYNYWWKCKPSS